MNSNSNVHSIYSLLKWFVLVKTNASQMIGTTLYRMKRFETSYCIQIKGNLKLRLLKCIIFTCLLRWCPTESARVPIASYNISKFLCCKTQGNQCKIVNKEEVFTISKLTFFLNLLMSFEYFSYWKLIIICNLF